jgi:hypothetical protein
LGQVDAQFGRQLFHQSDVAGWPGNVRFHCHQPVPLPCAPSEHPVKVLQCD